MKNKLQLFQVNPWQRLAAGDMFTVSDAFTARGLGNGLLVQKLLRETSVEFGVEWLIWQNKYLLWAEGMRQVTMKTLDTDALFRWLKNLLSVSLCCEPSLFNLRNQTDLDDFFRRGLACSQYLNCAQEPKRSGPQAVFPFLSSLSRQFLWALCI